MNTRKKLKLICKAFNSSKSIDEFKVMLDLNGIALDDATKTYENACSRIVTHLKKRWHSIRNNFSLENMFKHYFLKFDDKVRLALPYSFSIKKSGLLTKYAMSTVLPSGEVVPIYGSYSTKTEDMMQTMHRIDMEAEMFFTLLKDLSMEVHAYFK